MVKPAEKTIVLVGHCLPDRFLLKRAVRRALPGVRVKSVNDDAHLEPYRNGDAVLLVNRVLDGRFRTESGIELIRDLQQAADAPASLLVSNYPEAHEEAMRAGAKPGFGKRDLYAEDTARRLREAVDGPGPDSGSGGRADAG